MPKKRSKRTYRVWSVDCLPDDFNSWTMNDRSCVGHDVISDHIIDQAWAGNTRPLRRAMRSWLQPHAHVEFDMEEGGFWVLALDGYILYQFALED